MGKEKLKIIRRPNNTHYRFRLPNAKPSLLWEPIVLYPRHNQRGHVVVAHRQYDDEDVFAVRTRRWRAFWIYTYFTVRLICPAQRKFSYSQKIAHPTLPNYYSFLRKSSFLQAPSTKKIFKTIKLLSKTRRPLLHLLFPLSFDYSPG